MCLLYMQNRTHRCWSDIHVQYRNINCKFQKRSTCTIITQRSEVQYHKVVAQCDLFQVITIFVTVSNFLSQQEGTEMWGQISWQGLMQVNEMKFKMLLFHLWQPFEVTGKSLWHLLHQPGNLRVAALYKGPGEYINHRTL